MFVDVRLAPTLVEIDVGAEVRPNPGDCREASRAWSIWHDEKNPAF
jgi:hypothetical protein